MICKQCGEEKTELEFYPNNKSKCKKCVIKYSTESVKCNPNYYIRWRKNNPEKLKEYREKHKNKQDEYYLGWYQKNGRPRTEKEVENSIKWQKDNREKVSAHRKLYSAIKIGKIIRPESCTCCNKKARILGHHPNYSKPLTVVWVCSSCHKKIHRDLSFS